MLAVFICTRSQHVLCLRQIVLSALTRYYSASFLNAYLQNGDNRERLPIFIPFSRSKDVRVARCLITYKVTRVWDSPHTHYVRLSLEYVATRGIYFYKKE